MDKQCELTKSEINTFNIKSLLIQNIQNSLNGQVNMEIINKKLEGGELFGKVKLQLVLEEHTQMMEKKQGQWHELYQNYSKKFQVCEFGEYLNDQRIKQWKYSLGNEEIGGGLYDDQGKQGQWIELANNFQVQI
ncbi:unnamed protein product [Paramecium sonneborni]|uniref:Uncharacterized protein n=1 Tax=Paramecium sonneborni TaxID=65129 RepID=A0A8S1R8Q5_9CILI|nr:unnamed protein product [Paramecium sonneborni]